MTGKSWLIAHFNWFFRYIGIYLIIPGLIIACNDRDPLDTQFTSSTIPALTANAQQTAGTLTLPRVPTNSYVQPGHSLTNQQKLDFWTGFSLFRDPWVIAPSSTDARDGLGPLFNARSCSSCHASGSRGKMSEPGTHIPSTLVLRLGSTNQSIGEDPNYGGQIQPRSISKTLPAEAKLTLNYTRVTGQYPDGSQFSLQRPAYQLTHLSYGPLAPDIQISPRYTPNIYGMGLLDAIDVQDLLSQEDIHDQDQDGISAKYNRVLDVSSQQMTIGRFGLKAKQPNLIQQVSAAFRDDIGITNPLFPQQNCSVSQTRCQQLEQAQGLEINSQLLQLVVDFSRYIGVPPARGLSKPSVIQGRQWFFQVGCAHCHTPSYVTAADYPIPQLANVTIWPYTDLALHDMGPDLADGVREFSATGQEWRTPPLWGLGLQPQILSEPRYLHDGRARSLEEAILWHGGEAEASKQQFMQLERRQREQLLQFIEAI